MPLNIRKVLVCDAVDKSCVELLEQHGIKVRFANPLTRQSIICWSKQKLTPIQVLKSTVRPRIKIQIIKLSITTQKCFFNENEH